MNLEIHLVEVTCCRPFGMASYSQQMFKYKICKDGERILHFGSLYFLYVGLLKFVVIGGNDLLNGVMACDTYTTKALEEIKLNLNLLFLDIPTK